MPLFKFGECHLFVVRLPRVKMADYPAPSTELLETAYWQSLRLLQRTLEAPCNEAKREDVRNRIQNILSVTSYFWECCELLEGRLGLFSLERYEETKSQSSQWLGIVYEEITELLGVARDLTSQTFSHDHVHNATRPVISNDFVDQSRISECQSCNSPGCTDGPLGG